MTPGVFATYGSRARIDIDEASDKLADATGLHFEQRESSYLGLYYRAGQSPGENLVLQQNCSPASSRPREEKFPEHHLILYVNNTLRPAELRAAIERVETTFTLLRQEAEEDKW